MGAELDKELETNPSPAQFYYADAGDFPGAVDLDLSDRPIRRLMILTDGDGNLIYDDKEGNTLTIPVVGPMQLDFIITRIDKDSTCTKMLGVF